MSYHGTVNPQHGTVLRARLLYGNVPSLIHWLRNPTILYYYCTIKSKENHSYLYILQNISKS